MVDDLTVDFHMKQPDPVIFTKLAGYGAMIVPPKYIREKGEDHFNTHPVGTGPFKFNDYKPKVSLTLDRNDGYWGRQAEARPGGVPLIAEPATQAAELQAGRVDVATLIPLGLIDVINKSDNAKIVSTPARSRLRCASTPPPASRRDREVRRALTMAVDRSTIAKQILMGMRSRSRASRARCRSATTRH